MNRLWLAVLVLLSSAAQARKPPQLIELQVEVQQNRIDGCTDCRCRVKGDVTSGGEQTWWFAFGVVAAENEGDWSALGSQTYCGAGSFDDVRQNFTATVGTPYLVGEIRTGVSAGRRGAVSVQADLATWRFDGATSGYTPAAEDRGSLALQHGIPLVIPLLSPTEKERTAFGVADLMLQVSAARADQTGLSWGSIAVTGDVPGSAVYLDGGLAGRVTTKEPLVLNNVPAGTHEVRLKDYSGREGATRVKVKKQSTTDVHIDLLNLGQGALETALIPLGPNPQGFEEFWRTKDSALVVEVPAGEFLMGSPEGVGLPAEHPQHTVDLPTYLIDKNEVTWRQYLQFAESEQQTVPPAPPWGYLENYSASSILWPEADAYCRWVGGRLPSEAEWEKAARGVDGRAWPWGDTWDAARCNTESGGMHRPEPAGSRPACVSPYGVLDMVGSVREWAADPFYDYGTTGQQADNTESAQTTTQYVLRGGGWMTQSSMARPAYRHKRSPGSRLMDHGFRCVQDSGGASQ